jgi:hypothetical protein
MKETRYSILTLHLTRLYPLLVKRRVLTRFSLSSNAPKTLNPQGHVFYIILVIGNSAQWLQGLRYRALWQISLSSDSRVSRNPSYKSIADRQLT